MTIKDLISGFSLKRDDQTLAGFDASPDIADFGSDKIPVKSSILLDNYTSSATAADLFKSKPSKNMATTNNTNSTNDTHSINHSRNFFASDLVINGSIESVSNIEAMGIINGNVTSQNDVRISGKVKGNISGLNVVIEQAVVDGDVIAQGSVKIGAGAQITGNITCENFETFGSVRGNLEVKQLATFNAGSDIVGDINACKVSINEDAMLTGNLKITRKAVGKLATSIIIEA